MQRSSGMLVRVGLCLVILVQFVVIYDLKADLNELGQIIEPGLQGTDVTRRGQEEGRVQKTQEEGRGRAEVHKVQDDAGQRPDEVRKGCDGLVDLNKLEMKKRVPDAYIIGQVKCGTGALRKFLSYHPYIVVPDKLTVNYLTRTGNKMTAAAHAQAMPYVFNHQTLVENSPDYFTSDTALQHFTQHLHNATFIIILRDPVPRAISHFITFTQKYQKYIDGAADEFVETIYSKDGTVNEGRPEVSLGRYTDWMRTWMNLTRGRVEVVDAGELVKQPLKVLRHLETVLNIPSFYTDSMFTYNKTKGFYCYKMSDGEVDCMSPGQGRAHPNISEHSLSKLKHYYRPLNEGLFTLLGRRFSWG